LRTAKLQFDIEPTSFITQAAHNMRSVNSESAASILAVLAKKHFLRCFDDLISQGNAIRYQRIQGITTDSVDPRSLIQLKSAPTPIGHFDATLCQSNVEDRLNLIPVLPDKLHVESNGDFFQNEGEWFINAIYYYGEYPYPYLSQVTRTKFLKTIVKTRFQLGCYYIPTHITEQILDYFQSPCSCDQLYLMPHIKGEWHWIVRYICRICGKVYYCSCFREAFEKYRHNRSRPKLYFTEEEIPDTSDDSLYREGLCHLCRQAPSDLHYCSPMYGNSLQVRYGPYIVKTALAAEKGNPEDEVRLRLGIPAGLRWTSEFELFSIVKEILSDHIVEYQASPDWLGQQRLDIFVPSLKLAIEYQGHQHFEPVEYFGGEEGYKNTKQRDKRKADLCSENGITLLYFKYTESITKSFVKKKLEVIPKTTVIKKQKGSGCNS
jgi:hypothetical protein